MEFSYFGNGVNIPQQTLNEISGITPTDQTSDVTTTGATGVYTEASTTSITSTIDPTITNLGYSRCHDNGHAAPGKLVVTIPFAGLNQNSMTAIPDALARRWAGYTSASTGYSPIVIRPRTRGRGGLGTIDYVRDTYDVLDIIDSAAETVGSNVFGYTTNSDGSFKKDTVPAIVVGYSTGGLDALSFACRAPDRCLGVVLYWPNYDLGYDTQDSYYGKQGATNRALFTGSVQPGGDTRQTAADPLDEYLTRNVIDAITRIVAIPGGPHVWLLGDLNETEGIPSITRLKNALQSIPAAKGKVHVHLTQTGDSNRILHADGVNGASEIYAERYYFPYLLANATEWTMPRKSPAGNLRLLGWMKTKLFEAWLGANTGPKTDAGVGGIKHSAEFQYDDVTRRFRILPITSTNGYFQVIRDGDNRSSASAFTAGSEMLLDLNQSRSIASVATVGFTKSWRADQGVTNSSGVTNWVDSIGGVLDFAASSNKPALSTDGNGKSYIQFTAASSQKLVLNQLIVNPLQDFSIAVTAFRSSTTSNMRFFDFSHHGTNASIGLHYNGSASGYLLNDSLNWMIEETAGIGGGTFAINTIYTFYLTRRNGTAHMRIGTINGSVASSPFVNTSFTITGTNTTSLGAGWANTIVDYYYFFDGGIYEVDAKQESISEADIFSHYALMKSRWSF